MERTKLISVRIETENLQVIDELCKTRPYLNRSRVINRLLTAMLRCNTGTGLFDTLNCYDPYDDGIRVVVLTKNPL